MREMTVGSRRPAMVHRLATADCRLPTADLPFKRFRRILKQVCGMPDYERHREHARVHGCPVLTEREYYDQYLASRYSNGGSRCC